MTDNIENGADGNTHGPGLSELAHSAVNALGPEAGELVDLDPALFGRALAEAAVAAARKPAPSAAAGVTCAVGLTRATLAAVSRLLGRGAPGPIPPDGLIVDFATPVGGQSGLLLALPVASGVPTARRGSRRRGRA